MTAEITFNSKISKEVLNNYLDRSLTYGGLLTASKNGYSPAGENRRFDEDFRFIKRIKPLYIGRAAYIWGYVPDLEAHFEHCRRLAGKIHKYNKNIILEACIFEIVDASLTDITPIPAWVFEEFSLPYENRFFCFENMIFENQTEEFMAKDFWRIRGKEKRAVPDITRTESQMWTYYLAVRYIEEGIESLHMGQMMLIGYRDIDNRCFTELADRIRRYAAKRARRKLVLLNAHCYNGYLAYRNNDGKNLVFDFHCFPLRPCDTEQKVQSDGYQPAVLKKDFIDSIYGKSAGGINPNGWETDENPYFVEFDNSGFDAERDHPKSSYHPWGYDETSWFARQPQNRREEIVQEFFNWIKENCGGNGHLEMPCLIPLAYTFEREFKGKKYKKVSMFRANNQSDTCPDGFNLEDVIDKLWNNSSKKG